MNILSFILFGFICASIVVFIFITVSCVIVTCLSNKDQEDEEQIQWIKEYKDKN